MSKNPGTGFSRRSIIAGAAGLAASGFAFRSSAAPPQEFGLPQASELPVRNMERLAPDLWVAPLAEDIWVTCFTRMIGDWIWYPANGLIVGEGQASLLVDPGWDRAQGAALIRYARDVLGRPPRHAIATHFHSDRTGGVEALRRAGLPVYGQPQTIELARRMGAPVPDIVPGWTGRKAKLGDTELFHPGPGHSPDNIVVWHQASRTLFGGCLVKAVTATDIGNVEDADLAAYEATLREVASHYPGASRVVPGHGAIQGDAIAHTARLARLAKEKTGQ